MAVTKEIPANEALRTGYHAHYVRLGGERRRLTSFDPFNVPPATRGGEGREAEIARWLTADVPSELRDAQFDVATLLAKIEDLRDALWMTQRNMIEAESRAYEAENAGALGELAARFALLHLSAAALVRQNETLRAAVARCEREHGTRRAER